MLNGKEQKLLVCKTLDELSEEQAATTGSIKKECDVCGTKVWVIPRNLIITDEIVCQKCAVELAKMEKEVKIHLAKPYADMLHKIQEN
jgi:hypothetical protein